MAFHGNTEWDVRTTGSDANGGGFQVGATGTDYSQQDAAQQAYTDLVIDGATNTKITSAARPFTSVDPGNIINVTAGTGFTVQRVQIVSVDGSNVATCDKAVGTLGSTGGTGNLGGALLTPATAAGLLVSGNTVHVKAGTYTLTTGITLTTTRRQYWLGFNAVHRDGGTRPLITSATNSVALLTVQSGWELEWVLIENINFSHTAATRGAGITLTNTAMCVIRDVQIDGASTGILDGVGIPRWLFADRVEVKNSVQDGIAMVSDEIVSIQHSHLHDNGRYGFIYNGYYEHVEVVGSLIVDNADDGVYLPSNRITSRFLGNTIANNGGDGIGGGAGASNVNRLTVIQNNILYGNTDYGINFNLATLIPCGGNNAFGANGSGPTNNWTADASDVTLSADPFTNAAGGDYSLNNNAGGGALCKGAGYQVA